MEYMNTYFDTVDLEFIADMAEASNPDDLADTAPQYASCFQRIATEFCLASIRARGNWMQVNGHWYRKG